MIKNHTFLMKYAIDYLSKFSSSKENLVRILKKKIFRLKIEKKDKYLLYNSIENIILELEKNNFINDDNYVSTKINFFFQQGKSKIYIKNYFIQKGIDGEIINNNLEIFENQNQNWELKSAEIFARKKRLSSSNNEEKNLSKLARAGFNYEISKKILDNF